MKHFFTVLILLSVACSSVSALDLQSAASKQPYVLDVTPQTGANLTQVESVDLHFSAPLLDSTVTPNTVFILKKEVYASYNADEWNDLYKDVKNGNVSVVAGNITLSEDKTHVVYSPTENFQVSGEYVIVALPLITTPEHFPLNQTVAGDVRSQFESHFLLTLSSASEDSPSGTISTSASVPAISDPASATAANFDFAQIMVTEVVTDPQQDFGESSLGNGIFFDDVAGAGTVGSTDEYVEIFNGTDHEVDLSTWSLVMTDGSDVTESLSDSTWQTYFSRGGSVVHFKSGEVSVFGNPQGDMKNTLTVELVDDTGVIQQTVAVSDGNALDISNESYRVDASGIWALGEATPGRFEYYVPVPVDESSAVVANVAETTSATATADEAVTSTDSGTSGETDPVVQETSDTVASVTESSTADVSGNSITTDVTTTVDPSASTSSDSLTAAAPAFDFDRVLITEVVTDPQRDHGESSGGNGVKFDGVPGTGTIGSTDEYIELYNGTANSVDLSGWSLAMNDGTDVTESLSDTSWTYFFSAGGRIDGFLSGEVLVLGNPNGDMKNAIELDLIDQIGDLEQSLYVDDANADGMVDESYQIDGDGNWGMGEASPGTFEY